MTGLAQTKLNPTQIYILQMFKFAETDETKKELQRLLKDFYVNKVDALAQQVWEQKKLTAEALDKQEFHYRTAY